MAVFTNTGPGRVAYFIPKSTQTQQSAEEVLGGRGGMPRRVQAETHPSAPPFAHTKDFMMLLPLWCLWRRLANVNV